MGERSFGDAPMDFVVIHPPFILAFDLHDPSLGLFYTRHSEGFDALDIRGVASIDRLLIFTLLAQGDQVLAISIVVMMRSPLLVVAMAYLF